MKTFYWYDLETFGINTRTDRIAQFAGIRTDENLKPIAEPDVFYCQPIFDYLPNPESILVTGITPQHCMQEGLLEHEFASKIHKIFSEPNTCVVGYNSIRFDDEFIRSMLYRNLYDPYKREYMSGNSRWDLIDLLRATYALRPDHINWPMHEAGKPSFRLEELSKANGLKHTSAHDALSDVEATIQMAQLVRDKHPKLFDFALSLRNKHQVNSLLNVGLRQPIVHVSSKIPATLGCLGVFVPLAVHPTNKNGIICYDLSHDPTDLLQLDVEAIRDRIYTPQADLPEGVNRIHLKTIHLNKSPFVAPLSVLKNVDLQRLGLDYSSCKKHLASIKENVSLDKKVASIFDQAYDQSNDDVDEMIYAGFFSSQDRYQLDQIRKKPADAIPFDSTIFKDKRAAELINRYKARNFPELLTPEQNQNWLNTAQLRLEKTHGADFSDWFEHLNQLREQADSSDQQLLDKTEQFVMEKTF